MVVYYASATALAAPPKDLGESGAAVRIYTGQEWPIFEDIFYPFLPAPALWPLNILFSSFSRVRTFKPRRKIPIRTVFMTCQKTPKCASRESSSFFFPHFDPLLGSSLNHVSTWYGHRYWLYVLLRTFLDSLFRICFGFLLVFEKNTC